MNVIFFSYGLLSRSRYWCIVLICIAATSALACRRDVRSDTHASPKNTSPSLASDLKSGAKMDESEAVKRAIKHLRHRNILPDQYKAEVESREDGTWEVTILTVPAMPGGFIVVSLGADGAILSVDPGE